MRKKKFSKARFYRRLEAQNNKAVSQSETDWDVMQSGYPECQIYPDFRSNMEADLLRKPLYSKRCGRDGFVEHEALGLNESAENLRADGLFFNAQNLAKQPEPKPEFVPPPSLEKIGASELNNDSGLFGWCFLHMGAFVACALLLYGILQKLSH